MKPVVVEVGARWPFDGEVPSAAAKLRQLAEAAGWGVEPTYARAYRGRRLVQSLALRLHHPTRRTYAAAVWVNGRFDIGLILSRQTGFRKVSANDLKRWLRDPAGLLCPDCVGAAGP